MADIKLKNTANTEFSISHNGTRGAKSVTSDQIVVAVETINDFPANAETGDTVIVKDLNRGGTFIYDATQSAVNNGGTVFDGWVRQYSGAVNVKWFGAKGDGYFDNTSIIQNVVNYFDCVFVPRGSYIISSISLSSNLHLYGEGIDSTVFKPLVLDGDIKMILTNSTDNIKNIYIGDFTVDANRTDGFMTSSGIVHIENCDRFTIERVKVKNPYCHAFDITDSENGTIRDCLAILDNSYIVTANPDDGFAIGGYSKNVLVQRCYSEGFGLKGNESGFEVDDGPEGITIDNCMSVNCNSGVTVHTHENAPYISNITISNNTLKTSKEFGITIHARSGTQITNINVFGNLILTPYSSGIRVLEIGTGLLKNINIYNNIFKSQGVSGAALRCESTKLNFVNNYVTGSFNFLYQNTKENPNQYFSGNLPPYPPRAWNFIPKDTAGNTPLITVNKATWESIDNEKIRLNFFFKITGLGSAIGADPFNINQEDLPILANKTQLREQGFLQVKGPASTLGSLIMTMQGYGITRIEKNFTSSTSYVTFSDLVGSEVMGSITYMKL